MTGTQDPVSRGSGDERGPTVDAERAGPQEPMQIGVVAELTEVSIPTLRHWERVGLVEPSARSAGGFRLYTWGDVDRLRQVRRLKPLGFSLEDMVALRDTVDVLGDPAADPGQREQALGVRRELAQRVREAADRLRRHLAYAEELEQLLHDPPDPHSHRQ